MAVGLIFYRVYIHLMDVQEMSSLTEGKRWIGEPSSNTANIFWVDFGRSTQGDGDVVLKSYTVLWSPIKLKYMKEIGALRVAKIFYVYKMYIFKRFYHFSLLLSWILVSWWYFLHEYCRNVIYTVNSPAEQKIVF